MLFYLFAELPAWLENIANDVSTLWPIVVAVIALFSLLRWLSNKFKTEVKDLIVVEIEPLKQQLSNNGGSSVKDAVDRIEKCQRDMAAQLQTNTEMTKQLNQDHKELWREIGRIEAKEKP